MQKERMEFLGLALGLRPQDYSLGPYTEIIIIGLIKKELKMWKLNASGQKKELIER